MKPHQISSQLIRIANSIDAANKPSRKLVVRELRRLIATLDSSGLVRKKVESAIMDLNESGYAEIGSGSELFPDSGLDENAWVLENVDGVVHLMNLYKRNMDTMMTFSPSEFTSGASSGVVNTIVNAVMADANKFQQSLGR